jgi:dihydroorotate dehydrogenase
MPDWFYHTVSRPLLFRMPAPRARNLTLGFMGRLARVPLGPAVIDFLGHMRPDHRLRRSLGGLDFPTAVGLGPGIDALAVALPALARFGVGFLEVGPVTVAGSSGNPPVARRPDRQAVWMPDPPANLGLREVLPRLAEVSGSGLPLMVRLGFAAGATADEAARECAGLIRELAPHVHLFSWASVPPSLADRRPGRQWAEHVRTVLEAAQSATPKRPVLLCVRADADVDEAAPLIDAALAAGAAGLLIDGSVRAEPDGRLIGLPARVPALDMVRRLHDRYGHPGLLIGSGGVHEPEDALALLDAGADLVQVDSGLVYSGPGLPKRINEALLFRETGPEPPRQPAERPAEMSWFWTTVMGVGMLAGSLLALGIAATRVVLPYDEAFVGMSRAELAEVKPRLLAFMTHDRVSLAGTMVAIGVMYVGLSAFGIRRGQHWARRSVFASAFTGFCSFFLFLGFGYLDPFHAFVTAILFQFLLLGVHCRLGTPCPGVAPPLRGDRAWRRSLWGQLVLLAHGCGLLGAGVAISAISVSRVFVPEDLDFMRTTAEALRGANPRLVPLVAHDRATLGGMLLAGGWAFLLPALWGFRNGSAWLWWTMLTAGASAYAAAIGVHYAVGYTHVTHLLPAFTGLAAFLLGLGLSYSYLCTAGPSPADRRGGWPRARR